MDIMSSEELNSWFAELDMEDPMVLQDFMGDCLADYSPEDIGALMDEELHHSPSSGSECKSSTPVTDQIISSNSAKRQRLHDHHPCSPNNRPKELPSFGSRNNDDSNEETTQKSSTQTGSGPGPGLGFGVESYNKQRGGTTPAKKPRRLPEQCHNHIIAERQRRQTLSQRFIALSALIPGLKKTDKLSVLGEAISHMKQLKGRLKILEEENARSAVESVVVVKRSQINVENETSNSDDSISGSVNAYHYKQLPEIEARFSNKSVFVQIHCKMQKGVLARLMSEIERMHLSVTSTHVMPFNAATVDITIMAQMEVEFDMRPQDVVKVLRSTFE